MFCFCGFYRIVEILVIIAFYSFINPFKIEINSIYFVSKNVELFLSRIRDVMLRRKRNRLERNKGNVENGKR